MQVWKPSFLTAAARSCEVECTPPDTRAAPGARKDPSLQRRAAARAHRAWSAHREEDGRSGIVRSGPNRVHRGPDRVCQAATDHPPSAVLGQCFLFVCLFVRRWLHVMRVCERDGGGGGPHCCRCCVSPWRAFTANMDPRNPALIDQRAVANLLMLRLLCAEMCLWNRGEGPEHETELTTDRRNNKLIKKMQSEQPIRAGLCRNPPQTDQPSSSLDSGQSFYRTDSFIYHTGRSRVHHRFHFQLITSQIYPKRSSYRHPTCDWSAITITHEEPRIVSWRSTITSGRLGEGLGRITKPTSSLYSRAVWRQRSRSAAPSSRCRISREKCGFPWWWMRHRVLTLVSFCALVHEEHLKCSCKSACF